MRAFIKISNVEPASDFGGPGTGQQTPSYSSTVTTSSSRGVPIYVLFLIMLGSGIFTLILLWICVQYIYHRRRVRPAVGDLERMSGADRAWEANGVERTQPGGTGRPVAPVAGESTGSNAPNLESENNVKTYDTSVELTYVIMAGEDKPTFLARALSTFEEPPSTPQPIDASVTVSSEKE